MTSHPKKTRPVKNSLSRRLLPVIMLVWLVGMGVYVYAFVFGYPVFPQSTGDLPIAVHSHVQLQVVVNGEDITSWAVPAGIGISPGLWKNHTFDSYGPTGKAPLFTEPGSAGLIHIELNTKGGPEVANGFTLLDFFNIWGKELTQQCVQVDQRYCIDNYSITTVYDDPDAATRTFPAIVPSLSLRGKPSAENPVLVSINISSRVSS